MVSNDFDDQELAKEPAANMRPNDGLLAQAQMQWQFGDWGSLGKSDDEEQNKHPNKGMLALLSAAAHLQMGNVELAKASLYSAQAGGCSQQVIAKILISGVHNTLGRAFAVCGQLNKASSHFEASVDLSPMPLDLKLVQKARKTTELARLGIPVLGDLTSTPDTFNVDQLLRQALLSAPQEPALLIAAAESAQRHGQHQEAIMLWQKLAAVDGERMPQPYYDRLEQAYASIDGFPLGLPEEEELRGDGDKHDMLKKIHMLLQPTNYLEIGVQTGKSLALASCPSIGVDPMPQIRTALGPSTQVIRTTSDDFFKSHADQMIKAPLDLVFIDGMHLFEYALRDFINTEKYSEAHTVVVIDDIFPVHPAQAERDRRTRTWTGDVWKLLVTLRQHRPDLRLLLLDAFPTGLLCISELNKNDHKLQLLYDKILQSFDLASRPPEDIVARQSSVSCMSGQLEQFIEAVKGLRGRALT